MQGLIEIAFVVAVAENGVIGRGGKLPWRMPSDLKTFRRLTMGKPVIMGGRTFRSLPKVLDGRDNIVVTRTPAALPAGVHGAPDIDAAITLAANFARARGVAEIMVIGGADIYRALLSRADRIYLTRVHAAPEGDTTLADIPAADWLEVSRTAIAPDPRDEHRATLIVLERRKSGPAAASP